MKKTYKILLSATVFIALCTITLYAHSGRTDASGGHNDRKSGGYHYHNSGRSKPKTQAPPARSTPSYRARKPIRPNPAARRNSPKKVTTKTISLPDLNKPDFSQVTASKVVRVVDGDTIVVKTTEGRRKVRLIGIDTPETVHPSKPVEEYGKEASNFTKNLLKGEKVYLVGDPGSDKTDKYGRILAYVYRYPDGLFVNAEIIRQGYGHAYTRFPFQYMEEFRELEKFARKAKKGLWKTITTESLTENQPAVEPIKKETITTDGKSIVQEQKNSEDVTVYITQTGTKYHQEYCSSLSKSKSPMKLVRAKECYTACKRCNPPR